MSGWHATVHAQLGAFELDVAIEGPQGTLAIVGPNGSGKTTLLRALAGAMALQRAEIVVGDRVWVSTARNVQVPMEARRVGYVPQGYGLFSHLNVLDNVSFGLSTGRWKLPRRQRYMKARVVLDALGCGGLATRRVAGLSGGEQQRVALARALVIEPTLLLLDEPLAALDAITRRQVRGFLAAHLQAFEQPSVIVTHDVRDVIALGASMCVLDTGRVVQQGSLEAIRSQPATPFVAAFLGLPSEEG